jgi:hypothetical protein
MRLSENVTGTEAPIYIHGDSWRGMGSAGDDGRRLGKRATA